MSFSSRSLPKPTAAELARWTRIKESRRCAATGEFGLVEIHHLLTSGGLRIGHRYTVGLLPEVHAIVKTRPFKAQWPNQALLDRQDLMMDCERVEIPERRPGRGSTDRPTKVIPRAPVIKNPRR